MVRTHILIIGNGPYAQMMKEYVYMDNIGEVCGFVVDETYITQSEIDGIPVISFEQMESLFKPDEVELLMGVGYTQMGKVRKYIFEKCKKLGYYFMNYIHSTAVIAPNAKIGEGNNILESVIIESGVVIGDANLFFCGGMIAHETIIGSFNTFSARASVAGCVNIRNNCFFGIASVVKDHITIDEYVLVGAAAYAYKDLELLSVIVPAKSEIVEGKVSTDYL